MLTAVLQVRQERGDEVIVALVANKSDLSEKRVVTQVEHAST